MSCQEDREAIYKLSQIYNAICELHLRYKYLKVIVQKNGEINYAVPVSSFLSAKKPEFAGNTALHFAVEENKIILFESLVNLGANFIIKNKNGMNALHLAIHKSDSPRHPNSWKINDTMVSPFVDLILAKQISSGSKENPRDGNGISHFHAACMTNNVKAVEFFLNVGVSVDEAISPDSPRFPGFTPLHIVAKCSNVETAEMLVKYGANIHVKDSKKMTPLHVLIDENLEIIRSQKYKREWKKRPIMNVEKNQKIICLILDSNLSVLDTGLSPLHAACTTKNILMIEKLLQSGADVNNAVDQNSFFRPGYTALHFAALFNLDTVKLLLRYGADIGTRDAEGVTPLEICLEKQQMKDIDINFLISHHPVLKSALLSDNETKFIDLASALESPNNFMLFISTSLKDVNAQIPDQCIWPGYTPLHLVMTFYKRIEDYYNTEQTEKCLELVKLLLSGGADVTIKDIYGYTPLHIAFQLGRVDVVNLLCEHHKKIENPTDKNGLSHLHIACSEKNVALVEKLLSSGVNVSDRIGCTIKWLGRKEIASHSSLPPLMRFLPAGATALHIAVATGSKEMVQMLLNHGADTYAKDVHGMTQMHWILTSSKHEDIKEILSSKPSLNESVSKGGLSLLHIASVTNEVQVVKQLLDSGVDIETKITYKPFGSDASEDPLSFMSVYADFTALHFAIQFGSIDVIKLLVEYEADILAKFKNRYTNNIITPLYDVLSTRFCRYEPYRDGFILMLKTSSRLQKRVEDDSGFTMLHLACWEANCDAIKDLVKNGANVNAQLNFDAPMWPGFTPMQLLLESSLDNYSYRDARQNDIEEAVESLLDAGTDITLSNAKRDTLIHFADKILSTFGGRVILADSVHRRRLDLFLNRIKDFNNNSVNDSGMSLFHIACRMNNISIIKKFLEQQVDVRKSTDHFGSSGFTPLHLVLNYDSRRVCGVSNQIAIINLLVMRGADVEAEDSHGNTPFHIAAGSRPPRRKLFQTLLSHGADILAKNIKGQTPLEVLLKSKNATREEIKFLLENGCDANMFNPISEEGYLAMALHRHESDDSDDEDNDSRKIKFEAMINSALPKEDELGRSVIHNIVSEDVGSFDDVGYADIFEKLKSMGCSIDCKDNFGRTPLHTAARFRNWDAGPGILLAGSDTNLTDASGKIAFDCILESSAIDEHERDNDDGKALFMRGFALHIKKLLLCDLDVSQRNKIALEKTLAAKHFYFVVEEISENFYNDIEKTKGIKIGPNSLPLYNFLSETGAVSRYPNMTQIQKDAITKFFEVAKRYQLHHELREVAGLLKLQFRKAVARLELMKPAKDSLSELVRFPLPELCSEVIFRYLSNTHLQNLIEAAT